MLLARVYAQLSTCRALGMGCIGPIPMTAVWTWEDRHDVTDPFLRQHIENVISAIDAGTLRRSRAANRPTGGSGDNSS